MTQYKIKRTGQITDALGIRHLRNNEYVQVREETRFEKWIAQGSYKAEDGIPMILELDEETGATVLSPLHKIK
jgi:hypothetical protein